MVDGVRNHIAANVNVGESPEVIRKNLESLRILFPKTAHAFDCVPDICLVACYKAHKLYEFGAPEERYKAQIQLSFVKRMLSVDLIQSFEQDIAGICERSPHQAALTQ